MVVIVSVIYSLFGAKILRLINWVELFTDFTVNVFTEDYNLRHILPWQYKLDVKNYDLNLTIDFDEGSVSVRERIDFEKNDNSDTLIFNFYGDLSVSGVKINGNEVGFERTDDHIFLTTNAKSGFMEIEYFGSPENLGLGSFNFSKENGKSLFTINEPVYAPTWFVCNDLLSDKAQYSITISADSQFVSVSVGNLDSVSLNGSVKTFYWKTDYEIPSYLVSVYSGNYKLNLDSVKLNGGELPLQLYTFGQSEKTVENTFTTIKKSLKLFEMLFGEYPFIGDKLAVIEIPWSYGGIENYSAIGIGSIYFSEMALFEELFVHEISHSWWGNAVSPLKWSDIWLNEGLASYSEILYSEYYYGVNSRNNSLRNMRFENYDKSIANPSYLGMTKLTYFNAAWALHQLRREAGDSVFFKIIRKHYELNRYGNASTTEFLEICSEIGGEKLSEFFEQWILKPSRFPEILLTVDKRTHSVRIFSTQESGGLQFRIDMAFLNSKGTILRDTSIYFDGVPKKIILPAEFPIDSVKIDPENWLPVKPELKFEGTF